LPSPFFFLCGFWTFEGGQKKEKTSGFLGTTNWTPLGGFLPQKFLPDVYVCL
jgi:hypothetical protein